MDLAQAIILRLCTLKELGRIFPDVPDDQCCRTENKGFICTRMKGHTGLHVAHGGYENACHAWVNDD